MDYRRKNTLCIVAYVYGYKYQGWIPIYLFSIFKNYPSYHVRIYLDGSLSLKVKKSLNLLEKYQGKYEIIEYYYSSKNKLSNLENRSLRWLLCDKELKQYKYIYIGDIDIYICKEKEELLKQHIKHMAQTNLIYSNVLRLRMVDYLKNKNQLDKNHLFRLTGLHFFEVDKYFEATKKWRKKISTLILCDHNKFNIMASIQSYLLKKYITIDDERMLYFIVLCSGLGFPPCSYQVDERKGICFRPLHGIHFAIGRESEAYRHMSTVNNYKNLTHENEEDINYFKNLVADYNSNKTLRILFKRNQYILEILSETCVFFGYKLCSEEIIKKSV